MAIDWDTLLYSPVFAKLAVDALLTIGVVTHAVRVIDGTSGVAIEQNGFSLPEFKPVAYLQQSTLTTLALAAHDLHDQILILNGTTWRIKNSYARPVEGKASGDWMLVLIKES